MSLPANIWTETSNGPGRVVGVPPIVALALVVLAVLAFTAFLSPRLFGQEQPAVSSETTTDTTERQSPAAKKQSPGESRRILAAGERFVDARLGLSFTVPLMSVVQIRNRGNFHGVDVEPVDEAAFYIYHTTYRIRRPADSPKFFESLGSVFRPCELPPIPTEPEFDIDARCSGSVGLNEILRTVRLIRQKDVLHFIYVSSRSDANPVANEILASVRKNVDFVNAPEL